MCLWHIIWSKGNEIYSRDSFISPFLAFCSHLLLSPTAELGGQRERECVQFTAWEKELSWETTNRKRDTSITSTQPHTHTHTHTQSTLLARSNNGCFLTTGVTVTSTSCRSVRAQENQWIRKEPRSYSTSNHHQSEIGALIHPPFPHRALIILTH